jgi:8-oxo-dGTP pyrophosphatase MutT (NUDIX family)
MKRADVIAMLERHVPFDSDEGRNRMVALHMLRTVPDVFLRECNEPGHVTCSALVANLEGTKVLLNKHGISGWWMNFGGHADGDEDVLSVAKRELEEEAGITDALCGSELFDIDVHYMGPHMRKGQPVAEHIHADFTWLFRVPDDVKWVISDESQDIKWFTLEEAVALEIDRSDKDAQMGRFYAKILAGVR